MQIKPIDTIFHVVGLVAMASLAACANQPASADTSASAGGMMCCGAMDMEAACRMYRSMRDAPNEQERQALMERHMQGMSPEMRQRHMEMMQQQCQ